MSLTILSDLIQGSDEWLDQRRGIVTASVAGKLITPSTVKPAHNPDSRSLATLLAAERITGYTDPTYQNLDIWRGVEEEPRARYTYSEHYAEATECGFMVRDDWGYRIGYSPDGLVGDDGLIEVKAPRSKEHLRTILADEVPGHYMGQLQCGLLVSGREWIDYISFCGGMPMWVKRVKPDEKWQAAIAEAVGALEKTIERMVAVYRGSVIGLPVTERLELVVI